MTIEEMEKKLKELEEGFNKKSKEMEDSFNEKLKEKDKEIEEIRKKKMEQELINTGKNILDTSPSEEEKIITWNDLKKDFSIY